MVLISKTVKNIKVYINYYYTLTHTYLYVNMLLFLINKSQIDKDFKNNAWEIWAKNRKTPISTWKLWKFLRRQKKCLSLIIIKMYIKIRFLEKSMKNHTKFGNI